MKAVPYRLGFNSIRRFALFTCLLLGSDFTIADDSKNNASSYYEEALKHYDNQRYNDAIIQLKNAFQENPRLLPALVLLGKSYLETGSPSAAESAFSDALELGADLSVVAVPMSRSYLMQSKHDLLLAQQIPANLPADIKAELFMLRARAALKTSNQSELDSALIEMEKLTPYAADLLALKATLLMREAKLQAAEEFINRLTDLYPQSALSWLTHASLMHVQGKSEAALQSYAKVLQLDPTNNDARIARISLMMDLGRNNENQADLTALNKSIPSDPRVTYLRAISLARAGDQHGSNTALSETLHILDILGPKIVTRNRQLLMVAAITNYSLNNLESARDYLETYTKTSPHEAVPKRLLSTIYMRQGEFRSAVTLLNTLLEKTPNNPQLLSKLALAYDSAGNHQLSILTFEKALSLSQEDPKLQTQLAISKMNAGFLEQGINELSNLFHSEQSQASSGLALTVTLLNQGEFNQAVETAKTLLKQTPNDPARKNLLAIALVGSNQLTEAKTLLNSLLVNDPQNISINRNLAKIALRQSDPETARQIIRNLMTNNKRNPELILDMARINANSENLTEALRWARDAADSAPNSFSINSYLIDLLITEGDTDEALKVALDQESVFTDNLFVLEAQAKVLSAAGEKGQLLSLLRKMASLADFNAQWLLKIARYQTNAGSLDEAIYTLFRGLQGNPQHFPSRIMLTDLEIRLGRLEQAMEHAKQLIKDYPNRPQGYQLVGDIRIKNSQFKDAINSYHKALEYGKAPIQVLRLHIAQRYAGQEKAALQTLLNRLQQTPNDNVIKNALAEYYLSIENYAAATPLFKELLENQSAASLHNNLAYSLFKTEQIEPAISQAQHAYQLAPADPMINDTLGWLLINHDQVNEGLPYLREALTRAADNPEIRYHLAVALYKLERHNEARIELKTSLQDARGFRDMQDAQKLLKIIERH